MPPVPSIMPPVSITPPVSIMPPVSIIPPVSIMPPVSIIPPVAGIASVPPSPIVPPVSSAPPMPLVALAPPAAPPSPAPVPVPPGLLLLEQAVNIVNPTTNIPLYSFRTCIIASSSRRSFGGSRRSFQKTTALAIGSSFQATPSLEIRRGTADITQLSLPAITAIGWIAEPRSRIHCNSAGIYKESTIDNSAGLAKKD
jgi:hypothetical protein